MAAEHVRALGERIRLRREELGMTQDEVARQMSGTLDGQRISKWERGENRPRDESLEDLARVLKTTPEALLMPSDKPETPDPFPPAVEVALADILREIKVQLAEQTKVLNEIKGLLGKDTETAERMAAVSESLGGAAAQLDAHVRQVTSTPISGTPRKRAAKKATAPKRTPKA